MNPNQPKNWKDDPRLRTMNPEKVAFLDHLACEIQKTPKDQLMNRFLSLTLEAKEAGMVFTDQETDLMAGILVGYMSPTDRGKLKLFRMMSKTGFQPGFLIPRHESQLNSYFFYFCTILMILPGT